MLYALLALGVGVVTGIVVGIVAAKRGAVDEVAVVKEQVEAVRTRATAEAEQARRAAEIEARQASLVARTKAEATLSGGLDELARREERVAQRLEPLPREQAALEARREALAARERERRVVEERAQAARAEATRLATEARTMLERIAGTSAPELAHAMIDGWVETAKAEGAQRLRLIDANQQDPEYTREAKRVMGIAIGRYHGHYLTERLLTNLPLLTSTAEKLASNGGVIMQAIEAGANIKLTIHDTGDGVRLEGQDSVGREIARRVIRKIEKNAARDLDKNPPKFVQGIKEHLDREIMDLGKKAFQELEIPRAHPEIVKLVGMLNYRTSYTQNQWKHAVEASFIAGMVACELGLDIKLARRATLMHDIGKALTHAIDGSHAVIGADIARKLGEAEIVANAIGAHHGEEPCNSAYAHIVAACDAMSGGRPGARREQTDNYVTKLADLERIGGGFRGVDRAFAVQGGREVRVYVREGEVSDLRAVELSGEIARQISDQMTFPGQIKVTVIRQIQAVAVAS